MVRVESLDPVALYDFEQRVVFSPAARGEGFIKMAVTTGRRGARSEPHAHPRDEVTLTLSGEAILHAGGRTYAMTAGTAVRLPPGLVHEVEVVSEEWIVVAAYCDECTLCRGSGGAFAPPRTPSADPSRVDPPPSDRTSAAMSTGAPVMLGRHVDSPRRPP